MAGFNSALWLLGVGSAGTADVVIDAGQAQSVIEANAALVAGPVDDVLLVGAPIPLTITLDSPNEVDHDAATISHAIETSSDPGPEAAILSSDAGGGLALETLAVRTQLSAGAFLATELDTEPDPPAAGAIVYVYDTGALHQLRVVFANGTRVTLAIDDELASTF